MCSSPATNTWPAFSGPRRSRTTGCVFCVRPPSWSTSMSWLGLVRTGRELGLAGYDRVGIYSPQGQLVAAVATARRDSVLTVPLLRIANTGLADTLARQVLFQLRLQAQEAGATIIRITDRYPSASARLAAVSDGFHQAGDQCYVFVVDECGPAAQVEHRVTVAARQAGVPEPAPLRSDMPAVAAAELERIW